MRRYAPVVALGLILVAGCGSRSAEEPLAPRSYSAEECRQDPRLAESYFRGYADGVRQVLADLPSNYFLGENVPGPLPAPEPDLEARDYAYQLGRVHGHNELEGRLIAHDWTAALEQLSLADDSR